MKPCGLCVFEIDTNSISTFDPVFDESLSIDKCAPNTIWLHKSRSDILTIATCDFDGKILYGSSERVLSNGSWGTSGACPQIAGLASLLLGKNKSLSRKEVFTIINSTAQKIDGYHYHCQGHGIIDCNKAMQKVVQNADTNKQE